MGGQGRGSIFLNSSQLWHLPSSLLEAPGDVVWKSSVHVWAWQVGAKGAGKSI